MANLAPTVESRDDMAADHPELNEELFKFLPDIHKLVKVLVGENNSKDASNAVCAKNEVVECK